MGLPLRLVSDAHTSKRTPQEGTAYFGTACASSLKGIGLSLSAMASRSPIAPPLGTGWIMSQPSAFARNPADEPRRGDRVITGTRPSRRRVVAAVSAVL